MCNATVAKDGGGTHRHMQSSTLTGKVLIISSERFVMRFSVNAVSFLSERAFFHDTSEAEERKRIFYRNTQMYRVVTSPVGCVARLKNVTHRAHKKIRQTTTKDTEREQIMTLCGDWLWSAPQWSMPAWKEATLMVYGGGNNCQQYENEINKSTVEQGEREMKEVVEKQKRRV